MAKSKVTDFKKLGENIRLERLKQKLSRETLGGMADVSGATVANIENNAEKALFKNIVSIAKVLNVNLEDISY